MKRVGRVSEGNDGHVPPARDGIADRLSGNL